MAFPASSVRLAWTGANASLAFASPHYADRVAARSLARFQPALQAQPVEYPRTLHHPTWLPRRACWSSCSASF